MVAKKELVPFITVDEFRFSQLILFFTISKLVYGENMIDDLLCWIVYIPPNRSKYASPDPYFEIQEELTRFVEIQNMLYCLEILILDVKIWLITQKWMILYPI